MDSGYQVDNLPSITLKVTITNLTITNLEPIGAWSTDYYLGTNKKRDRVENRASWWSSGIGRQHIGLFIWSRKDEDFIKDVYFARI